MKDDFSAEETGAGLKPMQALTVAAAIAACLVTGALLIIGTSTLVQASAQRAPDAWPIGPADPEVARRHGHLDHSVLLAPGIQAQPDHPGRAIASYEAATD
jgi:hypothetical protein